MISNGWMKEALWQARLAEKRGEVPVGCVAILNGKVLASGFNQSISKNDPTAHAEIVCLRRAARRLKNYRLSGIILYVTVEPCAMCAGAMGWARVEKLVFGCWDPKAGACGSLLNLSSLKKLNHRFELVGGVMEKECRRLMQRFFKGRR